MTAQVSPRKAPRQSRSQATVKAILDATARILIERGFAAVTTNAVAERAGVSVGSLYQYFPNKEALVTALHARHGEQMTAVILRALTKAMDATLDDALAGLIEATVEAHRIDSALHCVLELQLGAMDKAWPEEEYVAVMEERIVALLAHHRGVITTPDLKLAAFMLMHSAHALIHAVVLERPKGVSLKAATQEIVRMLKGYLMQPVAA
jgi:AcrR family transcriptional regulator